MTTPHPFRIYTVLFLSIFVLEIYASTENFFAKLCTSPLLDSPLDAQPNTSHRFNVDSNKCFQNYSLIATGEEADHFCRKVMPFDVVTAQKAYTSVGCTWSPGSMCPPEYIQVYDKCYRTPNGGCDSSEKLASPSNEDDIRWLSRIMILYRSSQIEPLIVKMTKVLQSKIVNKEKYFEDGHFFDANGVSDLQWTMLMETNSIHQLKPGDIVQSRSFRRLCVKNAMSTGSTAESVPSQAIYPVSEQVKQFSTGSKMAHGTIKLPDGRAFITRNEYFPKLLSDGKLDNGYFHEICESICDNCVAASGELLTEIGRTNLLPIGRYHVPMSRAGTGSRGSENCKAESQVTERRKFYSMIKPGVSEYIPVDNQWLDADGVKYPTGHCSDYERFAVEFFQGNNNVFGFVDVPAFDRRPIICYKGVVPQKPRGAGECYKNSEMVNGKCKCKENFKDGQETELKPILDMKGYKEPGFICLPPPSCSNIAVKNFPYKGFFFLGDGSGTFKNQWNLCLPFVKMFKQFIPSTVPVWIVQWSSVDSWDCRRDRRPCPDRQMGSLEAGWSDAEYDRVAEEIFKYYQDGWTVPYHYIKDISQRWIDYKNRHGLSYGDRALVIMLSDGEAQDSSYVKSEAIRLFKKANLKMVGAQEGRGFDFTHYHTLMDDPKDHIRIPESSEKLNERLSFTIMQQACTKYQERDIDEAI